MKSPTVGAVLYSFFIDYLKVAKGLRPASISSYRDGLRLFLHFVAEDASCRVTKLELQELNADRVLRFLRLLETGRKNHVRTRNHRLAILRTFFEYVGGRIPEMLEEAERVARIPTKRAPPSSTHYLERSEIEALFAGIRSNTWRRERDTALLLFLYNTGARVQEAADLRVGHLDLREQPLARLHGKGEKWRVCPLWRRTADILQRLIERAPIVSKPEAPVFSSRQGQPLTRFGIYKIVRQCAATLNVMAADGRVRRGVSPHVIRHKIGRAHV